MKHKLINAKTGEVHICIKVTIDGFDYYVSDGTENRSGKIAFINNKVYKNELRVVTTAFGNDNLKDCKKVIATNNPNIDIPKVVDETWIFFKEIDGSCEKNQYEHWLYKSGYNKSQETHPFSEEDMMNLIEWMQTPAYLLNIIDSSTIKSTQELLQLWKEQQSKIIYYVD